MKLPVRVIGAWEEMKWALKCLCLTHRAGSELRARFLLTPCGCPVLPPHWMEASGPRQAGLAPCPAGRLPRPGPEGSLGWQEEQGGGWAHTRSPVQCWPGLSPGARTGAIRSACHLLQKGGLWFLKIGCSGWKRCLGSYFR